MTVEDLIRERIPLDAVLAYPIPGGMLRRVEIADVILIEGRPVAVLKPHPAATYHLPADPQRPVMVPEGSTPQARGEYRKAAKV